MEIDVKGIDKKTSQVIVSMLYLVLAFSPFIYLKWFKSNAFDSFIHIYWLCIFYLFWFTINNLAIKLRNGQKNQLMSKERYALYYKKHMRAL